MGRRETPLIARILDAYGARRDVRLWRNATSVAWVGPRKQHAILAGLCRGSSDLIGIGPGGKFVALEVKTGKQTPTAKQERFIETIQACGGIAGVVRSVEDVAALIGPPT